MAGIVDRIGLILRSNVNDLLSRAEDPEKIINQALMDMRQAQYEARMEVAKTIAEGKKLERDYVSHEQESAGWMEKAEQAIKAEREDLAREALKRRKSAGDLAVGLKEQFDMHQSMVERLKGQLKALDAKIDEAERKRGLLLARQKRAEAQRTINNALSRTDASKALNAFNRMEGKVGQLEDTVAAEQELEQDLSSSLEDEFAALSANTEIDDELAQLKARLGSES